MSHRAALPLEKSSSARFREICHATFPTVSTDPEQLGHRLLQRCETCGVSLDHDVAKCPDCGQRTEIGRRKAMAVAIVVVVTVAVIAALWAATVIPSSPVGT